MVGGYIAQKPLRSLIHVPNEHEWKNLPRLRGLPVWFRVLEDGNIEIWPKLEKDVPLPQVSVSP